MKHIDELMDWGIKNNIEMERQNMKKCNGKCERCKFYTSEEYEQNNRECEVNLKGKYIAPTNHVFEKGEVYDIQVIKEGIAVEAINGDGYKTTLGLKDFKIIK